MAHILTDDWEKLMLFKDIVEQGGFSHAARYRGITHSTVSKQLKALEDLLGVSLLERSSRSMNLTEAGKLAYQHSKDIHAHLEDLLYELESAHQEIRGELRIGSLMHTGKHIVQPAVTQFLKKHPAASVQLFLDDGPMHFTRNALDLAIRIGAQGEGSLRARKLMDNKVCLVASPELLQRHGTPKHPDALSQYPTVAYSSTLLTINVWQYMQKKERKSVAINPKLKVSDGNTLLDAVLSGVGVGYLSYFAAKSAIEAGDLRLILTNYTLPKYDPVYLIRGRSDHIPPAIKAFTQCLKSIASTLT